MFSLDFTSYSGILGVIWIVIILWAIIKMAQADAHVLAKAVLIVALLLLSVVGPVAWLLFGPRG